MGAFNTLHEGSKNLGQNINLPPTVSTLGINGILKNYFSKYFMS